MVRPRCAFGSFAQASRTGCAIALGSLAAATVAQADWTPVSGRLLNQMVPGSTVVIDAPMGFKLPIQHADDGSMTGEAGGLSFYLGSATDTGRWWVTSDKLCYKWSRWFKSEARCMKIRRDGTRIEWEKDDGETGTASMTQRKSPPLDQIADAAAVPVKPAAASAAPRLAAAAPPSNPPAASAERAGPPVASAKPATVPAAPTWTAAAVPSTAQKAMAAPVKAAPAASAPVRVANMAPVRAPALPGPGATAPASGPRIALQQTQPPYRVGGPPPPAYRVVSVAFDDVLNVRQGPSAEHPAIAALEPETRGVRMIGPCQGEWCFVRHADIVGWVNRYYLEEMPIR